MINRSLKRKGGFACTPLVHNALYSRRFVILAIALACCILFAWKWHVIPWSNCYHTGSRNYLQIYLRTKMHDDRGKASSVKPDRAYNDQGQPKVILDYFKGKRHGTFIEAGANDGLQESNSLPLELEYSWRGLLIEPAPVMYAQAVRSGRSAMFLEACLSPKPYPYSATFKVLAPGHGNFTSSHLVDNSEVDPAFDLDKIKGNRETAEISVECYPLYDIMVAAEMTKLDALLLDVQGPELAILKTLPWDLVDIELIQVENNYVHTHQSDEEIRLFNETIAYLEPRGYSFLTKVARDYLFVKNSI